MRKSIFLRYFTATAAILLASFVVFGTALFFIVSNTWQQSEDKLLTKNVKTISSLAGALLEQGNGGFDQQIGSTVAAVSQIIDADIYIVDVNGNTIVCSHQQYDCNHKAISVPESIMNKTASGKFTERGTMGDIYTDTCYTVGEPVYCNGYRVGATFASVSMSQYAKSPYDIIKALFWYEICILLIAFIVIYIITGRMTRPLRQMAQAAKKMEQGNFIVNIPVTQRDEVGLLCDAFNKMSASLGSLEEMRRGFISSVSHELKTPMQTISGFIDGILDGTIPPQDQHKYMQIVSAETKRLSRLVNSMLQLSRLENNAVKLNETKFNITDMLMNILFSFEARINEKQLDIRGLSDAVPVTVNADKDLIHQVLYNLIENAIKFTPENGYIYIRVDMGKHNTVVVHIRNSGEGLTRQEMSKVFERFYKTDRSRSTDKTGMGFGLFIVKKIVALHNGNIVVGSIKGEYTSFEVTLPNARAMEINVTAEIADDEYKKDERKQKDNG